MIENLILVPEYSFEIYMFTCRKYIVSNCQKSNHIESLLSIFILFYFIFPVCRFNSIVQLRPLKAISGIAEWLKRESNGI